MFQACLDNLWSSIFFTFAIYLYILSIASTSLSWALVSNSIAREDVEDLAPKCMHKDKFWNFVDFPYFHSIKHMLTNIKMSSTNLNSHLVYELVILILKHIVSLTSLTSKLIASDPHIWHWDINSKVFEVAPLVSVSLLYVKVVVSRLYCLWCHYFCFF